MQISVFSVEKHIENRKQCSNNNNSSSKTMEYILTYREQVWK